MAIAAFSDLSGLDGHWDGTTGFTESGGFVTDWADQSGNGNDIEISATDKPKRNVAGTALLMLPNLAAGTVNLPNSINSQSFTLFMVSDVQSSRIAASGSPQIANDGAMAYWSGVSDLSGISVDATSQKTIRGFVGVLDGTQTISGKHHQGLSIIGQAGGAGRRRFFAGDDVVEDATPFTANTQSGLNIGGTSWNTKMVGRIFEIVLYSRDLTDEETADVLALLRSRHSLPTAKSNVLVIDGDSLSYGTGEEATTGDNYVRQFTAAHYNASRVYNFAVPGQNVLQMVSGEDDVDGVFDATMERNILCVFNSDITHEAEQRQYCEDRASTGFEVFLGTPISRGDIPDYDEDREIYAASLVSAPPAGTTIVENGARSELSTPANTTYYQSDTIHLKIPGNTVLKEGFEPAVWTPPAPSGGGLMYESTAPSPGDEIGDLFRKLNQAVYGVNPEPSGPPVMVSPPYITGPNDPPQVGDTLTRHHGTYNPPATYFSQEQWENPVDGWVDGAATYLVDEGFIGGQIRFRETAYNDNGPDPDAPRESAPTGTVVAAP